MKRALLSSLCMLAGLVVVLDAQPAAANAPRRAVQGIQAGWVVNIDSPDCQYTDSGSLLLGDTDVQGRSGWVRLDFRHTFDKACARGKYAEFIGALDSNIKVIGLLGPDFWAASPAADFATHAAEIACDPAFDRVKAWEIWNEPDLNGMSQHDFGELVARSSAAIHGCNSGDKVISGGVTPGDPFNYLRGVDAEIRANPDWGYATLRDAIDGVGAHPYIDRVDDTRLDGNHATLQSFIRAFTADSSNGFVGEPLYLTEMGWRLPDGAEVDEGDEVTASGQCFNLVEGFDEVASQGGVAAATWFTLKDFGDPRRQFGLYDDDTAVTKRLAWYGYVNDNCDGPRAGAYNPEIECLEWTDTTTTALGTAAALAGTVTYEVVVAPTSSPNVIITRTTASPSLPLASFSPPLSVGDYYWRVIKIVDGVRYPATERWTFTYTGTPAPPANLTATPGATGTTMGLTWMDKSVSETGFEISGPGSVSVPANTTAFTWTGLAPGISYCFQIRSFNGYGASLWTAQACAVTPTPPAAPSNVVATVVTGTSIRVDWTDNANNETSYEVSDGTTTVVLGANATTYTWAGIPNGASKCFKVRAANAVGYSAWAGNACATTPTIPAAPTAPTAAPATGNSIQVTWKDNSTNEWGFEISNGTTSQVVGANSTSYTWGGLANGTYMCFRIRSYNLAGYSAWTANACATTPTIPAAPTVPAAVAASGTSIKVTWKDNSANEWGFEISNGVTSQVVGTNSTSYTWGGLANGTYMCFRVRSYNLAGYSAWTAYACTTTPTIPAIPGTPTATPISTSQIRVSWADRSSNETAFQIYNGVSTVTLAANTTTYTWGGLAAGTYMCFAIRSYNLAGYSAWTPYGCTTTPSPPAMPGTPTATPISTSQIRVSWADRSGNETGFQIYNGVTTLTLAANTTTYTWGGLASRTYMCFAIRSYNAYGYSAWTPYACTTTF